jgi:hypothetical protein
MKEVTNTKFLGIRLDQHMEWKTQIDLIIRKIGRACYIPSPASSIHSIPDDILTNNLEADYGSSDLWLT